MPTEHVLLIDYFFLLLFIFPSKNRKHYFYHYTIVSYLKVYLSSLKNSGSFFLDVKITQLHVNDVTVINKIPDVEAVLALFGHEEPKYHPTRTLAAIAIPEAI